MVANIRSLIIAEVLYLIKKGAMDVLKNMPLNTKVIPVKSKKYW